MHEDVLYPEVGWAFLPVTGMSDKNVQPTWRLFSRRHLVELILSDSAIAVGIHLSKASLDGVLVLRCCGGDEFGVIDRPVVVLVACSEAG